MARKRVPRSLAALPGRGAVERAHHKTEALTEILRGVAVKNQLEQPRAFHSVRDVAAHFRVPVSTVSRVYRRLEQEGLLSRVRGSKTVLQGLHFDRHLSVRAFVGLPASLSAFLTLQDYRMFFIRLRRELRLRGFAAATAYFEKSEAGTHALSARLKAYEVDTVIWFQPTKEAKETALRLADMGIRLLGVANDDFPTIPCRYQVRRDAATKTLLAQWKASNAVERVTLVQSADQRSAAAEETLQTLLDELEIKWSVVTYRGQRSEAFLRTLQKAKTGGIIFPSSALASKFCFRSPNGVTELLKTHRVALVNGPVGMPFAKVPDAKVDLVTVDWQLAAERIVNDLITQDAFQQPGPAVFEGEAQLRVSLSEFAQSI
jgi:DNA-binding LacI/PurR family transcriptional regulator